jgi:hypothetical protein
MAVSNSLAQYTYPEDWAVKLQERLDYPQNWKEICNVEYTNTRVFNNPYMSTIPSAASHTRGTAYTLQTFALTAEYVTINQSRIVPMFIDRADLAQQGYVRQMEMADLQGTLLNEYVETDMLANHDMWTNFDNESIGGGAGNITVSASNIDDIIRGIKREIREANGIDLAKRNGMFILWRAADFEILESFVQANGFSTADSALKEGTITGFRYMGVDHYVSNSHTAGHVFGGVKKIMHLGILKDTYGQVVVNQDPADTTPLSGVSVVSRVDWEYKVWTNTKPVLFDILVN